LQEIHERESLDFIFPNYDAELPNFIRLKSDIDKMGIKTLLPSSEQFEERQKVNLHIFGQEYGIPVPFTLAVNNVADIAAAQYKFSYPIIVKGRFYDAHHAYNLEQVYQYFNKISSEWGLPVILQQFVLGNEFNVVALGDGKGGTVGAVPMRKTYLTKEGKAWGGVTLDDPSLIEMTRKLIAATKWCGPLEIEMIKTDQDEVFLLEINPRFPAWTGLAIGAGQNLPDAALRLGMGESVKPFDNYEKGKCFFRYTVDHICDISEFEKIAALGELGE
jgi:carbamoyl-phosphate synthase large subunit